MGSIRLREDLNIYEYMRVMYPLRIGEAKDRKHTQEQKKSEVAYCDCLLGISPCFKAKVHSTALSVVELLDVLCKSKFEVKIMH